MVTQRDPGPNLSSLRAYKKWTIAAPRPRSAPAAAVCLGAAAPVLIAEEDGVGAGPATDLEGVGTPEVNGESDTEEAPEKAGAPAVADGSAIEVLLGLST